MHLLLQVLITNIAFRTGLQNAQIKLAGMKNRIIKKGAVIVEYNLDYLDAMLGTKIVYRYNRCFWEGHM